MRKSRSCFRGVGRREEEGGVRRSEERRKSRSCFRSVLHPLSIFLVISPKTNMQSGAARRIGCVQPFSSPSSSAVPFP